jgi:hypothetical protein
MLMRSRAENADPNPEPAPQKAIRIPIVKAGPRKFLNPDLLSIFS